MRRFYLFIAAMVLASCSQSPVSLQPSAGYQNPDIRRSNSGPSIRKISAIKAEQYQNIVISGSGFGTMQPYNGDSGYLQILDTTGHWSAGLLNSSQDDTVTLDVASWSEKKIVITGFTGGYGESYWVLHKGDNLEINVWNAQTHNGPATMNKRVK